ncbi:MAG: PHP domain-containing protein [Anaerolineales bacterium]|nr:PHP domain-containing protein [Anaerolineales bacterium]
MDIYEYVINLHMHTPYSDGYGSHTEIAAAAQRAGLDVVIVTDHNVWVNGPEGYHGEGEKRVLMLVGEEIHDQTRKPQKNHLLVFGADRGLGPFAKDPQRLIDAANETNALTFLAHPYDPPAPAFNQDDLSWVSWEVKNYTGIELWNGLSEFKSHLKGKLQGIYYAYNPAAIACGPSPQVLKKWDELLNSGKRVVAIGGSDAHALPVNLGPLRRTLFPYEFHFKSINTHIFTSEPFNGQTAHDRRLVLDALRKGHAFVGYDLPASTRGFRFTAQGLGKNALSGDTIPASNGVTLQIKLPQRADIELRKDGAVLKTWQNSDIAAHITTEPGIYRVEVFTHYLSKRRGWIYSNPIYVR